MKTQTEIELKKGIKSLKKGLSFWATKKSPNIKPRKVKINFKYRNEFIREKKKELRAKLLQHQTDIKNFEKMIDEKVEHYDLKLDTKAQVALQRLKEELKRL